MRPRQNRTVLLGRIKLSTAPFLKHYDVIETVVASSKQEGTYFPLWRPL
jgi:hypothetical protein